MTKKALIISLFFLTALAARSIAQQSIPDRDAYQVGGQTVYIPAPEGFVNGYTRIPTVTAHFKALEDPQGRTLAVHLPRATAAKIIAAEKVERLGFYTVVNTRNDMNNVDVTTQMFDEFAAKTEREFTGLINEALPNAVEDGKRGLAQLGKPTDVGIEDSRSLGTFDKRPGVFSTITLSSVTQNGQGGSMLGVMSYIVVKKRLLYIGIYREYASDADIRALKDFTRKWATEIIEANK